eukprot:2142196-Amphidinium_carterae.1
MDRPSGTPSRRGSNGCNYNRALLTRDDSQESRLKREESGIRPMTAMVTKADTSVFEGARRLYLESIAAEESPEGTGFEFLSYLSIDQDGGFHKVSQLWSELKIVWFVLLISLTFMNFFAILLTDLQLLHQFHSRNIDWEHPLQDLPMDVNSKTYNHLKGDMVIFSWAESDVVKYFTYSSVLVACFELLQLVTTQPHAFRRQQLGSSPKACVWPILYNRRCEFYDSFCRDSHGAHCCQILSSRIARKKRI